MKTVRFFSIITILAVSILSCTKPSIAEPADKEEDHSDISTPGVTPLLSKVTTVTEGSVNSTTVMEYEYVGTKISKVTMFSGGAASSYVQYSYAGLLTTQTAFYRSGDKWIESTKIETTSDAVGKTQKVIIYSSGVPVSKTEYTYVGLTCTMRAYSYGGGAWTASGHSLTTYVDAACLKPSKSESFDTSGSLVSWSSYTYDAELQLSENISYTGKSTPSTKMSYSYAPNTIICQVYTWSGSDWTWQYKSTTTYEYS